MIKRCLRRVVHRLRGKGRGNSHSEDLDVVLRWALDRAAGNGGLHYPLAYTQTMRQCIGAAQVRLRVVKECAPEAPCRQRAHMIQAALERFPPLDFATACAAALVADAYRHNTTPRKARVGVDVAAHFAISSSSGTNGRILHTIVHALQCRSCLELGTAYGMSAVYILEALKATDGRLTTVEACEPQFGLASAMLTERYGDKVVCRYGKTADVVPELATRSDPWDFVFHDAGHSREHYLRDFAAMLPNLAPSAAVLIDDIRWSDARFCTTSPQCYEGWREIVGNSRVQWAVEIDRKMGLVLV